MKTHPSIGSFIAATVLAASGFSFAAGEGWSSDFQASKAKAAETKADLLILFTGSDWCSPCIRLDKDIFSQEGFKKGVEGKFVLVEIDMPKDTSKLSKETQAQNAELVKTYQVSGYPTVVLCDADGRPYALGDMDLSPKAYVKILDVLRASKVERDAALASAEKLEGVEKAKGLISALKALGLEYEFVASFYGDIIGQIKAADPKAEIVFREPLSREPSDRVKRKLLQLDDLELSQAEEIEGGLAIFDAVLKEGGFSPAQLQQLKLEKAYFYSYWNNYDEALKLLDEAIASNPADAEYAKILDREKKIFAEYRDKHAAEKKITP